MNIATSCPAESLGNPGPCGRSITADNIPEDTGKTVSLRLPEDCHQLANNLPEAF